MCAAPVGNMKSDKELMQECLALKTVDASNIRQVQALMQEVSSRLEVRCPTANSFAKVNGENVMTFALAFLDLQPIMSSGESVSGSVYAPMKISITIPPSEDLLQLQEKALTALTGLIYWMDGGDVFKKWIFFLPKSTISPFKLSVIELLPQHDNIYVRVAICHTLSAFFTKITRSHLAFVEKKSAALSFTPLFMSLAQSLEMTHEILLDSLHSSFEVQFVSAAVRTLSLMFKKCPYSRLNRDLLPRTESMAQNLTFSKNFVAQIAGLNLYLALATIEKSAFSKKVASECCKLFANFGFRDTGQVLDANGRYVALQNLGTLAGLHLDMVVNHLNLTNDVLEKTFTSPDSAITLHTLRMLKQLAKAERTFKLDDQSLDALKNHFSSVIRPRHFQLINDHEDSSLRAVLCDFISEIGESVFVSQSQDRKYLMLTYLLNHCDAAEPSVRSSAFRGLGMFAHFQVMQSDPQFLVDCAEKMIGELSGASVNKGVVVMTTWAVANLAEAVDKMQHEAQVEFPRHICFKLLCLVTDKKWLALGTAVQVNILRSLGSLLYCVDGSYFPDSDDLATKEVSDVVESGIMLVLSYISDTSQAKIAWNACYAAGKILHSSLMLELMPKPITNLFQALMKILNESTNFKVKINAVSAIIRIEQRHVIGQSFTNLATLLTDEVERTENDESTEETQHKMDLVNELTRAFCHVLLLGTPEDLIQVETALSRDTFDNLLFTFGQVAKRASPEKAEIFFDTSKKLSNLPASASVRELHRLVTVLVN